MTATLSERSAGLSLAALPDILIPSKYLPDLRQGGFGLPGRELPLVQFSELLEIIRYSVVEPVQWFRCHELRYFLSSTSDCICSGCTQLDSSLQNAGIVYSVQPATSLALVLLLLSAKVGILHRSISPNEPFMSTSPCLTLTSNRRKSKHSSQVNLPRRAVHEQLALILTSERRKSKHLAQANLPSTSRL